MMIKTKLVIIFSLSGALMLTGPVSAHEEDYDDIRFDRVGYFDDVDANRDGKVSRDEYLEYNKDSRRYDREWREDHWEEMIEKFDYNDDQHITTAEVGEYVEKRVAKVMDRLGRMRWFDGEDFDFDFDGRDFAFDFDGHDFHGDFDAEEFGDRLAERMERLHERIERSLEHLEDMEIHGLNDDKVFRFRHAPVFELKRSHRLTRQSLDKDDDGVISQEEFMTGRKDLFERLDRNGDGVLGGDEMDRYPLEGFAFRWGDDDKDDE